jgi:hypothetical protein
LCSLLSLLKEVSSSSDSSLALFPRAFDERVLDTLVAAGGACPFANRVPFLVDIFHSLVAVAVQAGLFVLCGFAPFCQTFPPK